MIKTKETLKYKRIVIKIGSNVLTGADGTLDAGRMSLLVAQIALLLRSGVEIIVVSSGAVASGRGELGAQSAFRKLDPVSARQLFSAVGQVKLINTYYHLFREREIDCGQVLTTKESLSSRNHYLNQKNCMEVMLHNKVVPIVNENDTISVTELMFTDNDELSGMVAAMMNADGLIILSAIDGIYNGDPSAGNAEVIREIEPGNTGISNYIFTGKSQFGRGGMITKSRIARKVADEGIEVIIANGKRENILIDLVLNRLPEVLCTRFVPLRRPVSGVKKWIAHSDGFAKGAIHINPGAYEALMQPKAASLLPVGVESVEGRFEKDDIVRIVAPSGENIGVGRATLSAEKARQVIGKKGAKALIHYDYMYLD
ncbi:MAG: glutamate 5-kinase [Dysgonamonadaceae bacterium]|jgi:glutamate 5-kinase|nr:glutamate 5-kinase [Dysgonamonadaceae bacterium]